jgi:NAD(P)-dependent dehydrogenase (short-subunit alcohol dehydrogenase family)
MLDDIFKLNNRIVFATPKEIADSVVFLCSDKASFITDAILVIDRVISKKRIKLC